MTAEQVLDQMIADLKLKEKISEYEGGILKTIDPEWASENLHFDTWNKTYLNPEDGCKKHTFGNRTKSST
jgi:hypothetical protein